MAQPFQVDHLDVDLLLSEWRWLCPGRMSLVARGAFGDLFLRDELARVFRLKVDVGRFSKVAETEARFRELAGTPEKRNEWFAEADAEAAACRDLKPSEYQCIGFKIPLVFAESGPTQGPYLANIYEYVSFLGDLNRQLLNIPDGTKVRVRIKP